jgi:hypothetical protein
VWHHDRKKENDALFMFKEMMHHLGNHLYSLGRSQSILHLDLWDPCSKFPRWWFLCRSVLWDSCQTTSDVQRSDQHPNSGVGLMGPVSYLFRPIRTGMGTLGALKGSPFSRFFSVQISKIWMTHFNFNNYRKI